MLPGPGDRQGGAGKPHRLPCLERGQRLQESNYIRSDNPCRSGPLYLRLSITDRCNLRCDYCKPHGHTPPDAAPPLSDEALVRLVGDLDAARTIGKLRLTGGEPLVRPGVVELVQKLRARLPGAELCLTTNGTRLARLAEPLGRAGVSAVNISIDTLNKARFKALTGGRLDRVIQGAEAARDARFKRLKLNAVLQRSVNGDELPELLRFAGSLGAELRFIELMPMGSAAATFPQESLRAEQALARLRRAFPYLRALGRQSTATRHLLRVDGRDVTVGFITPVSHPFCRDCSRLRLDAFGLLSPCLRRGESFDLTGAGAGGLEQANQVAEVLRGIGTARRDIATGWPSRVMASIGG